MMSNQSVSKRKYRNPLADFPDQSLFFGAFLVGGAAIWYLKALGLPQYLVTIVPLGLMLLYAIAAIVSKRFRIREDRVGDNIYYLGFLYTLVSLAYALYVYNPDGSGATDIITNFGVAIFTTIFGLAGRVLFNQMREDPVEYEREARYSLAEASMALRTELSNISAEMSSFKRKIVQITEEGVVDVSNSAKESMSQNVKSFSGTAGEVIESIRSAFGTFTDHSTKLNEIASKNVEALQSLFNRIEQIEASPEIFAEKFDPVIKKFEEVADEALKRNRAQTNDLKRIRESIEVASSASATLQASITESEKAIAGRIQRLNEGFDKAIGSADGFTNVLVKTTSAIAELRSISSFRATVEEDLAAVHRHREALEGLVTESRESVKELQTALVSLSHVMVEQLGGR